MISCDVCGCFRKLLSVNFGRCRVLWLLNFLRAHLVFDYVSRIYSDVVYMNLHITGSMCVGVTVWFGWCGVVSGCRLKHYWSVHVECGGWGVNDRLE